MFKKISLIKLIIFSYILLAILIIIPFHITTHYFNLNIGGSDFQDDSLIKKIFLIVIFGPALETLIFQVGIISIIKKILPKLPFIAIIISALFFGLSHFYSTIYIYYTFMVGLFLGTLYFIASKRGFNPFLVVFSVHALNNLILFITFEYII